jgi:hypothetical protein
MTNLAAVSPDINRMMTVVQVPSEFLPNIFHYGLLTPF